MIEIISDVLQWYKDGYTRIVLAVLVDMDGSAVRNKGAAMAIREDGLISGSVSGGCIESTVLNTSRRVFATEKPEVLTFCQIDDEILGSVSPCGGEVTIAVSLMDRVFFHAFCRMAETGRGGRWGIVLSGPNEAAGSLFAVDNRGQMLEESFSDAVDLPETDALGIASVSFRTDKTGNTKSDSFRIFSAVLKPVPKLVIVGASHIGIVLKAMAELTGYMVTVIDPRGVFTRKERFQNTERIYKTWPRKAFREIEFTPYTALAVITHDTKIDDQALELALKTKCFYIGALGSAATHRDRIKRLEKKGLSEADCASIYSPIGLPIQSAGPEEIALSIMAEIVKEYRSRYGKDG